MKHKSAGVATLLSFFWPGLGQIYNGQIFKGLLFGFWHLMAGLSMIASAMTQPAVAAALGFVNFLFWMACMFDAHGIAEAYNEGSRIGQWRGSGRVLLFSWGSAFILGLIGGIFLHFQPEGQGGAAASIASQPAISAEAAYLPNIRIENVHAGEGYTAFDIQGISTPKKGIYGSVRNLGDRTLGRVEIIVYFLDKRGVRIGEKTHLVISKFSFTGDNEPLKPNYVKDFGFSVEGDAPSEWTGKVEVAITEIEFV